MTLTKRYCLMFFKRTMQFFNANEGGRTKLVENCFPTGDNKPIQQRQYPIPSIAREHINTQLNDMLKDGVIRQGTS